MTGLKEAGVPTGFPDGTFLSADPLTGYQAAAAAIGPAGPAGPPEPPGG